MEESPYAEELVYFDKSEEQALTDFFLKINAKRDSLTSFLYKNEVWFIDFHPYDHLDDIIIEEHEADKYQKFLLVKRGSNKIKIAGWTDLKTLKKIPAKDIYRIGKKHYLVNQDNKFSLESFKILKDDFILKKDFIINQQEADNYGHTEMISGILAGLHYFCKKAKLYFKDTNQKDEAVIENKKIKIFCRDYLSDEDMLIPEEFYQRNKNIDVYILCKIKGGKYSYLGFVEKDEVDRTRVIQMTGSTEIDSTGEQCRRIFSDQYINLSEIIKIYEKKQEEKKEIIQQKYIPLHVHSEWSVGDGFGKVDYLTACLKEQGFKGAALTDHGTLAGVWEFQKQCFIKDLKPIIGCEFYVNLEGEDGRYHLTLLVKNKKGWENILKLQDCAVRKHFYYKPIIILEELFNHSEGLIALSGCSSGIFAKLLEEEKNQKFEELIKKFKEAFKEDFYIEIQPQNIKRNQEIMQRMHNYSLLENIKCVITTDSHYPLAKDKEYHDALKAISLKKKYGEAGFSDDCFFLMKDEDLQKRVDEKCSWMKEELEDFKKNTFEVFDKCNFKIEAVEELDTLPKFDSFLELPSDFFSSFEEYIKSYKGEDLKNSQEFLAKLGKREKYFINLSYKGLQDKGLLNKEYQERLSLELLRIIKKGYVNYFLIMWDMARFCKEKDILKGPGRGSVGASLVAYCLDITSVDPIKHDLLFDRFISSIRKDFVDIDMDYQDDRRQELFDYLSEKYKKEHCSKVATYSRFHPKGVLRDLGRIFDVPGWEINKVASLVIERSGGDARASFSLQDTFEEFAEAKEFQKKYPLVSEIAMKLESHIRHKSSHAAAIILTEKENSHYAPINKIGGVICFEWEKQMCEDMHLIKFDILGLKTLSILKDACKSAKVELPKDFEDKEVYKKIFIPAETVGIFQLGTVGMQKYSSQLAINSFNDLFDATTLFRPSCISGSTRILKNNFPNIYCETEVKNLIRNSSLDLLEVQEKEFKQTKGNAFCVGEKELFRIETEDGNFIDIGKDHKIMTLKGWKKVKDLTNNDFLIKVEPEENKEFVKCQVCKKNRKNLARNHLTSHKVKPKNYKGKLFSENEFVKIRKQMSENGKKGYIAQQKVQPTSVRVALAVKACKGNDVWKAKVKAGLLKIREKISKKRIQFLKDHPEKHPAVLLAARGNVSYQQESLFNKIKEKFLDAKMEVVVPGTNFSMDIFIPSLNLDIEYDGGYWHSRKEAKEKDNRRDKALLEKGIKTLRITKENLNNWKELLNEKVCS